MRSCSLPRSQTAAGRSAGRGLAPRVGSVADAPRPRPIRTTIGRAPGLAGFRLPACSVAERKQADSGNPKGLSGPPVRPTVGRVSQSTSVGRRAARSFGASSSRQALTLAIHAGTSIALTRLTVPEVYGTYVILAAFAIFAQQVVSGPLSSVFVVAEEPPRRDRVNVAFWLALTAMSVCAAGALAGAAVIDGAPWSGLLAALAGYLVLAPLRLPAVIGCYRQLALGRLAVIEMCSVVAFSATAVTLVALGFGATSFAIALVADGIAGAAASVTLYHWRPRRPSLHGARPLVRSARPFFVATATQLAKDQLTLPLVGVLAGTAVAGLYSWAFTAMVTSLVLADLLGAVLLSAFARMREDREALRDAAARSMRVMTWVVCVVTAVVAGAISPIVNVIFSPRWEPAIPIALTLAPAMVLQGVAAVPLYLLASDGRPGAAARLRLVGLAVFWALAVPLGLAFGGVGVAVAYGLGAAAVCAVCLRVMGSSYTLPGSDLIRLAACCVVAFALAWMSAAELGDTFLSLLVSALVGVVSFGVLSLLAVARLREDARRAVRLLRRDPAPASLAAA